jgi:3-hydroxybutyryl-CoA dehydrogenase
MTKAVTVIGMGRIGKSISLTLAQNNFNVTVVTRRGAKGFEDLCLFVKNALKTSADAKVVISRISWVATCQSISPDTEFVFEAVKENLREKQLLFECLDKIASERTILTTTTSSLSVTDIASLMNRQDRMIGFHFFNPANIMNLIEIIPNKNTSENTIRQAKDLADSLGKTSILVPDTPGFLVNRILFVMINEAIKILSYGTNTVSDIDTAMKLGANHPMGPLRLADFIGLDTCLTILENLYKSTKNAQYKPHPLLINKVKLNNLGLKTGKGFYAYAKATK